MRLPKATVIAVGMAALVLTAGCGKSLQERMDDARRSARTDPQAEADREARGDYLDEWQAFQSAAEQQLAAQAQVMDRLKAQTAGAALTELAGKHRALSAQLAAYKDEGKVGWDAFRRDFTHDLDRLGKALQDLDAPATP